MNILNTIISYSNVLPLSERVEVLKFAGYFEQAEKARKGEPFLSDPKRIEIRFQKTQNADLLGELLAQLEPSGEFTLPESGRATTDIPNYLSEVSQMDTIPIGAYVIVRSHDDGCKTGVYQGHIGREVQLTEARQIYRWEGARLTLVDVTVIPKGTIQLSHVAHGVTVMLEACGILQCTPEVEKYLREMPAHNPEN